MKPKRLRFMLSDNLWGLPMDENWDHIQQISRNLTEDYSGAVFIGGVAVAAHASRLGSAFLESSHDGDLYLSLQGKFEMRDRFVMHHNKRLNKDSVTIEGEDLDVYVEHNNSLGIDYAELFASSEDIDGIRVAALEHLLVLKLDAAMDRQGTPKGEKDIRDIARIVALLDHPREPLLAKHMTEDRSDLLNQVMKRRDLAARLGLNPHEGKKFTTLLDANYKAISSAKTIPELVMESVDMSIEEPLPKKPKDVTEKNAEVQVPKPTVRRRP